MMSRREVLTVGLAAGVTALVARTSGESVNFEVPDHACDCHTHVFGDPQQFPFALTRTYTPEIATIEQMRDLHRALGISRVVIVQPSVYGTDNSCTLDGIRKLGSRARGVAVIDEKTSERALDEMHQAGIRGIRLNLRTAGQDDPAVARELLIRAFDRISRRRWHVQIYTRLRIIEAIQDQIREAPAPVVIDHFGGADARQGTEQPGFPVLLGLVRSGKAYVKISAPYMSSTQTPDYPDAGLLAKALVSANSKRILWGTNWPHPGTTPPGREATDLIPHRPVDDAHILNQFAAWAPDPAVRKRILVDNPANLYGF